MSTDLERDHVEALANLTATQTRCTELLTELRDLRRCIVHTGELVELAGALSPEDRDVLVRVARRLARQ